MTPTSIHLSEQALNDVLIGLGSQKWQAHLAVCLECRAKVDSFRTGVRWFNSASLAWSQSARGHAIRERIRLAFLGWATTAVAAAVIALAIWAHHPVHAPGQAKVAPAQDSEAQIAEDNRLLEAVNAAISPDEESLINAYLTKNPHGRSRAHFRTRTK